jgi:hypothetical protein
MEGSIGTSRSDLLGDEEGTPRCRGRGRGRGRGREDALVGCAITPELLLPAWVVAGWYWRWTWSGKDAERAEDG